MLSSHKKALLAPLNGLKLCLKNKELRKLAFWPFLISILIYFSTMTLAYFLFEPLLEYFKLSGTSSWTAFINKLIFLGTAALLLVSSLFFSVISLFLSTSLYQSSIAKTALEILGEKLPDEENLAKETARTVITEIIKILWIAPLLLILFIAGFIPLLTPICLAAASWLLAYQFVDVALDIKRLGAGRRLAFSLRHASKLILFGGVLTICWSVPFLGIFLLPSAAAGASCLVAGIGEVGEKKKVAKK